MTSTNKGGRPSIYTEAIAEEICERLAEGESLRNICRSDGMPKMTTVLDWVDNDRESFRGRYARAREAQAETELAEIQEIEQTATPETANLAKMQIAAKQWRCAKLNPKKYSDKIQHVGGDGESAIESTLTITFVRPGDVPRQDLIADGEWTEDMAE